MAKLPISVFIIAKNEADRIPLTIRSVRDWVDEVIVVDSGSNDDTVKIAEENGAKILYNEWKGYGPQKIFGQNACRNDWILNLDADEEITQELQQEIQQIFNPEHKNKAYRLKIHAIYPHQKKLPYFPAGTSQVRLYNRQTAGFKDSTIHDSVVLQGAEEICLKGSVTHRSFRSHAHAVEKIDSYTSMQAEDMFRKGRNPSVLKIVTAPPLYFIKCYFLKRYMFYGLDGFIHACIYSFGRTLRLAKARELFQNAGK